MGDAIGKIAGVVDVQNGIETQSADRNQFQIDPLVASRLGFTPTKFLRTQLPILDGVKATDPLIDNGRPYRFACLGVSTALRLTHPEHGVQQSSGQLRPGSLAAIEQFPPQNESAENLQRLVVVTGRLEGSDLGSAMAKSGRPVTGLHLPPSVRVEYGGTYEEQQKSSMTCCECCCGAGAGLRRAAHRVPQLPAPIAILPRPCFPIRRDPGPADHRTTFNVASFMGLIMVIGIVGQKRHSAAGCGREVSRRGASAKDSRCVRHNGGCGHCDDRDRRSLRNVAAGFALGAGSQIAATAGQSRHRRTHRSMLLSLV